jgi:hypothetical protein
MVAKHTRGPWVVHPEEVDKPYIRVRGSWPGSRHKVANVMTPVYDGAGEAEAEETRANARLIAAAPDLLASLKHLVRWHDQLGKEDIARAEAVIAKAEGRS